MKSLKTLLVITCALGLLLPAATQAQVCPNPIPIACGASANGDTTGGPNNIPIHSPCIGWYMDGPEVTYLLTVDEGSAVTVTVTPEATYDTGLSILPVAGGDCNPDDCLIGADDGFDGDLETATTFLPAGSYYVVVDSWDPGAVGTYTLDISCTPCADADGDGFADVACGGDDCDDANPDVNPGVFETCGNGVDEDCDGTAQVCPDCTADAALDCAVGNGSGTTNGGTDSIVDYCGSVSGSWTGTEFIYSLDTAEDTFIDFSLSNTSADLDLHVTLPFDDGICNPNLCVAYSRAAGGDEAVSFWAYQEWTYYLSIDGYSGADSSFDYNLICFNEGCTADTSLACGEDVDATSVGGSTDITYYGGLDFPFPGPEYTASFTSAYDGDVTVLLTITDPVNLALLVLEDDGDGCEPATFFTGADQDNAAEGDFTETVTFQAAAGTTYYFVVDSQIPDEVGAFNLAVDCVLDCGAMTQCGAMCVDTDTDTDNCGGCDTICNLDNTDQHECVAGVCGIATCDANFDDCDVTDANGCESNLMTSPATCGDCNTACSDPTPMCTDGMCTDACGADMTDCGGSCVDLDTDEAHCGACDNDCNANMGNVNDASCAAGVCAYDACMAGYLDCDADVSNGCEATEAPDVCGAGCVDCTATVMNVGNVLCDMGACGFDACADGYLNCDGDDANGCEQMVDDANCGVCGNDCGVNATCVAGVCTCDATYADCDMDAGCETMLGTADDCLACDDACGANGVCDAVNGCGCADGFADCNDDVADGCEVALGTVDNCGACADACAFDNGTPACNAGMCGLDTCNANYDNCDGDEANGCETDLSNGTDCGACGTECGPLEACTGDDVNGYTCTDTCTDVDGDSYADADCGGSDCDDSDANVNPGADETCNDEDDDCDGAIDEGFDADADGYKSCGAEADCDDADASVNPGATEICQDGVDNDCSGGDAECACADADKDGYFDATCDGDDCDDADNTINPGATELCDEVDNDCDGLIDEDGACDGGTNSGCGCASANSSPAAGGLLLLALVLGLALPRRRDS